MIKKLKPYIIGVSVALGVGLLSSLLTMGNMDIYSQINTPPLSPPAVLFPIVWTILYILMGVSAALVYKSNDLEKTTALTIWAIQLAVNFFWSPIFFNMRAFFFSFIWLVILDVLVVVMIVLFHRISPLSAWLQLPYLLWILFATYLNFAIFLLNR